MLMCVLLGTGLPGFGQDEGGAEFDSLGYEIDSLGMIEAFEDLLQSVEAIEPECIPITYTKAIPVRFESSFALYIELSKNLTDSVFLSEIGSEASQLILTEESNDLVVMGLPYDSYYVVSARNSCGEISPFYAFSTADQTHQEGDMVEVFSEEMFLLASAFGVQEESSALDLPDFLNASNDVHRFEKLNFYQQFARGNEKYPNSVIQATLIPKGLAKPPRFGEDCKCEQLIRRPTSSHGPSRLVWDVVMQLMLQYNDPEGQIQEYFPAASNVTRWGRNRTKGASIDYLAHTNASGGSKCDELHRLNIGLGGEVDEDENVLDMPVSFGLITVNLICNDRNELPKHCDCSKTIDFDYRFQGHFDLDARRRNGTGCKSRRKSGAATYLYGIAYCSERRMGHNGVNSIQESQLIDLLRAEAVAECNTEFNPEWDEAFIGFLGSIFGETTLGDIINADDPTDVIDEGAEVVDIVETLLSWARTPYFLDIQCDATSQPTPNMMGHASFTLEPNKQLWFYVGTSALARSMGQRRWISTARVRTAYGMTLSTTPGKTDKTNVGCCSNYSAAYVGGSIGIMPFNTNSAWRMMGESIKAMNDDFEGCVYYSGGQAHSRGDFGICEAPAKTADCEVPINERSSLSEAVNQETLKAGLVLNAQGQVIKSLRNEMFENRNQLDARLRDVLQTMPSGIYLIQCTKADERFTLKYAHFEH